MSGNRQRWPRFMRRKFGPEGGTWYCCGGRLMRSMEAPGEEGVTVHVCSHCGRGLKARGNAVSEFLQPAPDSPVTHDPPGQMRLQL